MNTESIITPDIITLESVCKHFGGVRALVDVTFGISKGEVHAIVGENGAGKSTLMKILAGVYTPDSGQILLRGEPVRVTSPLHARKLGISIVFQELNLFPTMSVSANMFVSREKVGVARLLNKAGMSRASAAVLADMGVKIDPDARISTLPVGEKQLVEIARTLTENAEIVIMDEPNSALNEAESQRLFEIIRRLRDGGITILYISHRLEEVFAISDRISVIRDGRYQGTWEVRNTTIPQVISAMVGHSPGESFPERKQAAALAPLLKVENLERGAKLGPVSFEARAGEIVGLAGLEGSGVSDVFYILFGLDKSVRGTIIYDDTPRPSRSPLNAIKNGWGLIPASRRDEGLMMEWSIERNATLLVLNKLVSRLGLVRNSKTRRKAEEYVSRLNIATDSVDKRVVNLSGGNQQKVLLAKWLATVPRILILNDPTRGVDVGAKAEIYRLCAELAEQGMALLFSSSELEETLGLCDRILAFRNGKIVGEYRQGEASKAEIMHKISAAV